MAGFLNCNASCTDGGFLQRCGSVGTSYWMWYENCKFVCFYGNNTGYDLLQLGIVLNLNEIKPDY